MLAVPSTRVDQAISAIRDSGSRVTVDRRAVIEALDRSDDHLTAEELAEAVWAHYPDINLATIYRTLELLERLEIAFHVHLGHGPSRWHLADDVHHHLVCELCGKVVEISDSTFDPLRKQLRHDSGFVIDPHHFSLSGVCADCAEASGD
jgi:Fur family ferric uptake transcriptional regulator